MLPYHDQLGSIVSVVYEQSFAMPEYGDRNYWNKRYTASDTPFDWMCSYDDLAPTILPLLPPNKEETKLLIVGCGDAPFSSDLYKGGYTNQLNVDYSEVVVKKQKKRWPQLDYRVMNCLDLREIAENAFGT